MTPICDFFFKLNVQSINVAEGEFLPIQITFIYGNYKYSSLFYPLQVAVRRRTPPIGWTPSRSRCRRSPQTTAQGRLVYVTPCARRVCAGFTMARRPPSSARPPRRQLSSAPMESVRRWSGHCQENRAQRICSCGSMPRREQ